MLDESWERVERWLASNAPELLDCLLPPASDQQLAAAEAAIGHPLPSGLRDLYRRHDGMDDMGNLFFGLVFLPLSDAIADRARANSATFAVSVADAGIVTEGAGTPIWVPFAKHGHSCRLYVDLSPAPGGTVGQVIFVDQDHAVVILVAPSVDRMLCSFADDLEAGKYFLNAEALEDGWESLDCVPEIDLLNWWLSPRWAHLFRA